MLLTEKEINDRFEENRKLLGNFPLAINLIRYKEVFNQAILAISLQAELDRLKAELADERESAVIVRNMTEDSATIGGDVQKLVIVTLWKMFHESGVENYLVMNVQHNDEAYELTMQKKGMLSPADLNKELKAEIAQLKAEREWIPVGENKPKSGVHVFLLCEIRPSGKKYVCDGFYAEPKSIVANSDDDGEVSSEYDEATDEYYLLEGWYEVVKNWDEYSSIVIEDFVTHWQPLPSAPEVR